MQFFDHTFNTPYENLACDELLLAWCETGRSNGFLRLWEPREHFIVLGYSKKLSGEINRDESTMEKIPVCRRFSGGGTVLQGPGCLNYSLILPLGAPEFSTVRDTNCHLMKRMRDLLQPLSSQKIEVEGFSDLAIGGRKFSGNAQRRGRKFLLFHGTILYDFDLNLIERALKLPDEAPEYRQRRSHRDFLMCLRVEIEILKMAIKSAWPCTAMLQLSSDMTAGIQTLVNEKYSKPDWIEKF